MALILADRVKDTTTTTGTGTVTLSGTAPSGFQNFSVIGNGNTTFYTISGGSEWEVGVGTYSSTGPTLARTTVLASSNSGSLVTFSAGTKDVFVTYPAEKSVNYNASGNVGVGTSEPTSLLNIYSATSATFTVDGDTASQIFLRRSSTNSGLPIFMFNKSRGTIAARTAVASGDGLGTVRFQAFGGTTDRIIASITGAVDTYVSDGNMSSYLTFATSASGSAAGTERMRIDSSGNVGIGLSTPTYRVDTSSASFAGVRSTNTDATSFNQFNLTTGTSIGLLRQYGQSHATNPNELSMVSISGPVTFAPGATERLRIAANGAIGLSGANYGTSGQVLTWQPASGGLSRAQVTAISMILGF